MKKILLSIAFVAIWMCFVNAQNNNPSNPIKPKRFFSDSSMHKMPQSPKDFKQGQWNDHPPFARQNFANRFGGRKGFGMMQNRMHLSPEQRKQSQAINQEFHKQIGELQKNDKISLGEYKQKLAALQKEHKAKLQALLTDKQKQEIAVQKKNREVNQKVRQAAMLERMKLTLSLSDEQVAKIKSNHTAIQAKAKAIRENDNLLPEQKREQKQSLMKERKDAVESVLTTEQKTKADSIMKNHRPFNFGGRWNRNNFIGK